MQPETDPSLAPSLEALPMKYTADRDIACSVCSGMILKGAQCYRFGDRDPAHPDMWQHLWHLDKGKSPSLEALTRLREADYQAALEILPDSLGRPLVARIQLMRDNLQRESRIGCELRRELDGGIERDARAIEGQWPEAAAFLRSHAHIEDGV